jgi:hypothetical protein
MGNVWERYEVYILLEVTVWTAVSQKMYTICQLRGICEVVVGGITGRDWTDQVLHCVQKSSMWGKLE